MASTLFAYLWGTPKTEAKTPGGSIPQAVSCTKPVAKVDAVASCASTRTWKLPTELWIAILENVPRGALAQVMLVSHSLSEMAEGILYRFVSLKWSTSAVLKLTDSIATCARRGALVTYISIFRLEGMDDRVQFVLPKLLNALPNLRTLELRSPVPNTMRCDSVLSVRLPHLRKYISNLKIVSDNAFFDFLATHEDLEELDLRFTHPPDLPAIQDCLDTKPFSSLRVLACSSRFLNSRRPVLTNLTHLYRTSYLASEVVHIAALLGPQLVSLRLGGRLVVGVGGGGGASAEPRWSLDDFAAKFPRLRFLQVDSPYKETPYVDTSIVDWLRPRKAAHSVSETTHASAARPMIVWTYYEGGFWSDAAWARTYDQFLDDAALKCLREWRGYERYFRKLYMYAFQLEMRFGL